MVEHSGFGVAYNARPVLRKVAKLSIEDDLSELIPIIENS
jgi:phosphoserine phosphatase